MNLRAKPIEGFVTDSAGNTVRSPNVVIKEVTTGSKYRVVDTCSTDPSGYFRSKPLKCGVYEVFESGEVLTRVNHFFGNGLIPAFKPTPNAFNPIKSINDYNVDSLSNINDHIFCVQIESDSTDIQNSGHVFPTYFGLDTSGIPNHYGWQAGCVVTPSRFNIEYFYPNANPGTYRYVSWRGVRAIGYSSTTPMVIPLTYWDLYVDPVLPISSFADIAMEYTRKTDQAKATVVIQKASEQGSQISYSTIGKGDIASITIGAATRYGIIYDIVTGNDGTYVLHLQIWLKTGASSFAAGASLGDTTMSMKFYQGLSQTMESAADTLSDRLTIMEDFSRNDLI